MTRLSNDRSTRYSKSLASLRLIPGPDGLSFCSSLKRASRCLLTHSFHHAGSKRGAGCKRAELALAEPDKGEPCRTSFLGTQVHLIWRFLGRQTQRTPRALRTRVSGINWHPALRRAMESGGFGAAFAAFQTPARVLTPARIDTGVVQQDHPRRASPIWTSRWSAAQRRHANGSEVSCSAARSSDTAVAWRARCPMSQSDRLGAIWPTQFSTTPSYRA